MNVQILAFWLISLFFAISSYTVVAQEADTTVKSKEQQDEMLRSSDEELIVPIDYRNPKSYILGGISAVGSDVIRPQVVVSFSGLLEGETIELPGNALTRATKKLWKQKLFSDVNIVLDSLVGEEIFITIHYQTRPRLSKFKFEGATKGEAGKIREDVKLRRGEIITEQMKSNAVNTIVLFYQAKGFYNAKVNTIVKPDSLFGNNGAVLVFDIDRGNKVKINEINFVGNTEERIMTKSGVGKIISAPVFSDRKLKRVMKETNEAGKFRNILKNAKFLRSDYEEDLEAIIAHYNRYGYKDARIVRDSVYMIGEDRINIDIEVDEGPQYFFRDINWVGNTKYSSATLSNILGIKKGDIYSPEKLQKGLMFNEAGLDVSSLYMDNGYLFFNVIPQEKRIEGDSVDMEIRIVEGPQATIRKVTIKGNDRTSDHVILREIRTRPGDKFSRNAIIRSQRELSQLQYFDPEQMDVQPKPNPEDGSVDIEYTVVERPSDQLELQGGWGANMLIGSVGFVFNNFSSRKILKPKTWSPLPSGDGQRFSIRGQSSGLFFSSINASFTEPWFGGKKPNSLTVSMYRSMQSNGRFRDDPMREDIVITGVTVGMGKRLRWPDDYFTLYHAVNFQHYSLNNFRSVFSFSDGNSNNFNFQHTLGRNSVDQPIFPRKGSKFSLGVQYTPPWSLFRSEDFADATEQEKFEWIEFHKWKFESEWFNTIIGKLVLNTRVNFGFLGLYDRDIGITPFERFYVGGDGLTGFQLDGRELIRLRGYDNNSLTPQRGSRNDPNFEIGGTIYNRYVFELRYPLSLNPSATVYVTTFAEGGNSWLNFKEFDPFDTYRSLGAGVRVFLPMFGLLGFDWAYGFDEIPGAPNANGSNFHISIGQQF